MRRKSLATVLIAGILIGILLSLQPVTAQVRTFKPYKVDVSIGGVLPAAPSNRKGGVLLAIEPKYALTDQIAFGVRLEGALIGRRVPESRISEYKAYGSGVLTTDYYFSTSKSRLFVGLGVGAYRYDGGIIRLNFQEVRQLFNRTLLGVVPRAGAELGHFRVAVEYNFIEGQKIVNNNYLSLKLGVLIGGGKVDK